MTPAPERPDPPCHRTAAADRLLDTYAIETATCCGLAFEAHDETVADHVVQSRRLWNAQLHDMIDNIERQAGAPAPDAGLREALDDAMIVAAILRGDEATARLANRLDISIREALALAPATDAGLDVERLRAVEAAALDVDAAWNDDEPTIRWSVEAAEVLADLRAALSRQAEKETK